MAKPLLIAIDDIDPEMEEALGSLRAGSDEDGLPRTDVAPDKRQTKTETEHPEVVSLRQKLDEGNRERERISQEMAAERSARETEKVRADKAEKDRDTNSTLAIRAHRDAVTARYQEAAQAQSEIESGLQAAQAIKGTLEDTKRRILADDNLDPRERANQLVKVDSDLNAYANRIETLESGKRGVESRVADARQTYEETERRLASLRDKEPETKEAEPEKKQPEPKKAVTADDFIANAPIPARAWLREHKEFAEPDSKELRRLSAYAASWLADNNRDPNDPKAWDDMDAATFQKAMDAKFFPKAKEKEIVAEDEPEDEGRAEAQEAKTTKSYAAPPTRSSAPNRNGNGRGEVPLDSFEQDTAMKMYPDLDRAAALKRYARNKAMALRDGLYKA